MPLSVPNLDMIRQNSPETYEALRAIIGGLHNIANQTNSDPGSNRSPSPQSIAGFKVVEKGGIHDLAITDNSPAYQGVNYFAEYSQSPDFSNAHQIDMGASQNHRANLGAGKYYWRAFSSYGSSQPSAFVYHGGAQPRAVGSGIYAGPDMQKRQGGVGYGPVYRNSSTPPVRG